ncbi:MAG: KTSC domain-containing protein [Actinomycetota bacterium]|nr:KTSC domain-containing protein [Actinomycetota bacterium]
MRRTPVDSTSIASIGYDSTTRTLEAAFHNDHVYQYLDVPKRVYWELMSAASIGRFFNAHIRDEFEARQVT